MAFSYYLMDNQINFAPLFNAVESFGYGHSKILYFKSLQLFALYKPIICNDI